MALTLPKNQTRLKGPPIIAPTANPSVLGSGKWQGGLAALLTH